MWHWQLNQFHRFRSANLLDLNGFHGSFGLFFLKKRFRDRITSRNLQLGCRSSVTLARPRRRSFVMAEKKPQTFANHTRWDPLFHFFVLPVFFLLAIAGLVHFIWRPWLHSGRMFVVAVALALAVTKIALNALRFQERVIRLAERLRLSSPLPTPSR